MAGLGVWLKDGLGSKLRAHLHRSNGDVGLKVFTEPLRKKKLLFLPMFNEEFGIEMRINGAFTGAPDLIHDGLDNAGWTGSNITGNKVTFNNADTAGSLPISGLQQVLVNNPVVNDVWEFDKESSTSLSSSIGVSFKVLVDSDWGGDSVSFYGWNSGTGLQVGNKVFLEDYFQESNFDVIQGAFIPFLDMGLTASTITGFRMQLESKDGAKAPKFYLDLLQIEEATGGATFSIEPPVGKKYLMNEFRFTLIDDISSTLGDATMHNLRYDNFMGISKLANGVAFTLMLAGVASFSANITCIADSTRGGATMENVFGDATSKNITFVTRFIEPVVMDSRTLDRLIMTIQDDLTPLISFTAVAIGSTIDIGK